MMICLAHQGKDYIYKTNEYIQLNAELLLNMYERQSSMQASVSPSGHVLKLR